MSTETPVLAVPPEISESIGKLHGEVERYPGLYDVYRLPERSWSRYAAWWYMCSAAGSCYGWSAIWATWARRRLGRWVPPIQNRDNPEFNRDYSGLVHSAIRFAGGPQVEPYDCDVAPGDLLELPFMYVGTLFP